MWSTTDEQENYMTGEIITLHRLPFGETKLDGTPDCVVRDHDKALHVQVAAKNWQPHELSLQLRDSLLTIQAKRLSRNEVASSLGEGQPAAFHRVFRLPECVDREKVRAVHKGGILTISFLKRSKANARRILVEVA